MRIGYIVHNLNDPAVERRCVMLERGGAQVRLAGFCRERTLSGPIAARMPMLLGQSQDAAMVQRAISTLRTAVFNGRVKQFLADCDLVIARNLEQLGIARTIIGTKPLVYECLDIHHTLVGTGKAARAVQSIEAQLLPRVNLLITSSPAFVDNHFASTTLNCPVELVENKLLVSDVKAFPPVTQPGRDGPLRIGWFGMLRCRQTLRALTDLTNRMKGSVEILIAGKPSSAVFPNFFAEIAANPLIEYAGPYRYEDLPGLYGRCHFAWTIDWFEEGENSSWLLPNRIYEAVAHGSIPIALAKIEVGRWLDRRKAGLLVSDPDEVTEALTDLSEPKLAAFQQAIRSIERRDVLADSQDCNRLTERLRALLPS